MAACASSAPELGSHGRGEKNLVVDRDVLVVDTAFVGVVESVASLKIPAWECDYVDGQRTNVVLDSSDRCFVVVAVDGISCRKVRVDVETVSSRHYTDENGRAEICDIGPGNDELRVGGRGGVPWIGRGLKGSGTVYVSVPLDFGIEYKTVLRVIRHVRGSVKENDRITVSTMSAGSCNWGRLNPGLEYEITGRLEVSEGEKIVNVCLNGSVSRVRADDRR
jgi:hypothetical protein